MRFLVLEEPMSPDGKQQFIPPLKTISLMRQLGANMRMRERERERESERARERGSEGGRDGGRESGDVLELKDDRGKDPH